MVRPGRPEPILERRYERLVFAEMASFGPLRPGRTPVAAAFASAIAAAAVATAAPACGGSATVPIRGEVFKTVGRPCALLSAAFPGVGHRIVTFLDPVGGELGRTATGAGRERPIGSTGCRLSAAYAIDLPIRHSYAADVSSQITDLPASPPIDYDALAGKDWRFDIRIPPTG
jgi:hypothetical protein